MKTFYVRVGVNLEAKDDDDADDLGKQMVSIIEGELYERSASVEIEEVKGP